MTKYTLFHHYKHKKGLVCIENNHFVGFKEEISAIIKKFPRPWVMWVARFSMSVSNPVKQKLQNDFRGQIRNLNRDSVTFVPWYFERLENVFTVHKSFSLTAAGVIYSAAKPITCSEEWGVMQISRYKIIHDDYEVKLCSSINRIKMSGSSRLQNWPQTQRTHPINHIKPYPLGRGENNPT